MTLRRSKEANAKFRVAEKGNLYSPTYAERLFTTMEQAGEHPGFEHARWRDWRPDLREGHQAFAVARNPWSRAASRYTFAVVAARQGSHTIPANYSFRRFLEERHEFGGREFYWHRAIRGWFQQRDYVTDEDGNLRCDVLRLEKLDHDAARYLKLRAPLRRRNVSGRKDYRTYFGTQEHDIVAEWYAEDIEYFGFTFDGPARRHLWKPISSD